MKRIWFGALLLALLPTLGALSSTVMEKTWLPQSQNLAAAARLAAGGSWEAADKLWQEASREWEDNQSLAAALTHDQTAEQISRLFTQLEVFSASRSAVPFRSTCLCLAQQLHTLSRSHRFRLKDLF